MIEFVYVFGSWTAMQQQQSKLIKLLVEQTWITWTYFVCHVRHKADNMFQNALKGCVWRSSSSHNIYPVLFVYFRKLYFFCILEGNFFIYRICCFNIAQITVVMNQQMIVGWYESGKNCVEIKCRKKIKLINASVTIAFFDVDINAWTAL